MCIEVKYRVREVAKDFGLSNKEITEILTNYAAAPKSTMQVLTDEELSIIFEYLTQHHQIESLAEVFAEGPQPGQKKQEGPQGRRSRQGRPAGPARAPASPRPSPPGGPAGGEGPRGQGRRAACRPQSRCPRRRWWTPARPPTSTWIAMTSTWRTWPRSGPSGCSRAGQAEDPPAEPQPPAAAAPVRQAPPGGAGPPDAPAPAGDRQEGSGQGSDPRRDRRGRTGQPDEKDRRRSGQDPDEERLYGLPVRRHRLRHRRPHRRGAGLRGGARGHCHHRGEADRRHEDKEEDLVPRAPVVVVMGHVDHGKTSLLDYIRHSNVPPARPAASPRPSAPIRFRWGDSTITFLDTPGHEAFTAMRGPGRHELPIWPSWWWPPTTASCPRPWRAINHAKAAEIPIIVAINKMDKPGANPDRIMQQLTEYGLVPEEWGGDTIICKISAKTGEGVDNLLDMMVLTAEMRELKANPNRSAKGRRHRGPAGEGPGPGGHPAGAERHPESGRHPDRRHRRGPGAGHDRL